MQAHPTGLHPLRFRAACLGFTALVLLLASASSPAQVVTEFSAGITLPAGPLSIVTGPDGNLWFAENASKIGRITPAGVITEFTDGFTPGASILGITLGADGNLWFTDQANNKIGRITPAGVVVEFGGLTANAAPTGIAAGPDGNIWFTEQSLPGIGRITTSGGVVEFGGPAPGSGPFGITAGPDGNVWFTEGTGDKIGRITPAGTVTEFPVPPGQPLEITAGPDGALWFTDTSTSKIGRITQDGTVNEFSSGITGGSSLRQITAGPDGNIWFTEAAGNRVARITPTGTVTEFGIPSAGAGPVGITSGPDGNVWFTEASGNRIGRITTGTTPLPPPVRDETLVIDDSGKLQVFSRTASGNVAPLRSVTSASFNLPVALAVDEIHGEVFVANLVGKSIDVFPLNANGNTVPLRTISGALTLLGGPNGIAVDPVANEIFVTDLGPPAAAIRVYSRTANGNVAPLRSISGAGTALVVPSHIRLDRTHGEICAIADDGPTTGVVAFYPLAANGNVLPLRTIPVTTTHSLAVDPVHDEVFVSSPPIVRAFSRTTGTLLRTIVGGGTGFVPGCGLLALSVDTQNDELTATTCGTSAQAAVLVFPRTADGNVGPIRSIVGAATGLASPGDVTVTKTEVLPLRLLLDTQAGANANGNGVLEPGEEVDFVPTWKNGTTASVALTSALSNFTGPAGVTYGISTAAASYGTLFAGTTVACAAPAQCPAVSISVPASRPIQHWDASVLETPSSGNVIASWRIHIGGSFTDVPSSVGFYRFVETIFHNGVTGGCGGTSFCPGDPATRAQMSVFLLISKEGASYVPPAATGTLFTDVPASNGFARWIEELAHRGVTVGCGGGNFCPNASVTRAQMAVFLLVTREGVGYTPLPATGVFADVVPSSGFAPFIEELARRGITAGCGGGNFCPSTPVTRGQMAVFLTTTFSLGLTSL